VHAHFLILFSDRKTIIDPSKFGLEAGGRYWTNGLVYGLGKDEASLEEIIDYLERTYCGVIALEVSQVMVCGATNLWDCG